MKKLHDGFAVEQILFVKSKVFHKNLLENKCKLSKSDNRYVYNLS